MPPLPPISISLDFSYGRTGFAVPTGTQYRGFSSTVSKPSLNNEALVHRWIARRTCERSDICRWSSDMMPRWPRLQFSDRGRRWPQHCQNCERQRFWARALPAPDFPGVQCRWSTLQLTRIDWLTFCSTDKVDSDQASRRRLASTRPDSIRRAGQNGLIMRSCFDPSGRPIVCLVDCLGIR